MSAIATWLRAHPRSRALVAGALVLAGPALAVALRLGAASPPPAGATGAGAGSPPTPAVASTTEESPLTVSPSPTSSPVLSPSPTATPAPMPAPSSLADATAVARGFVTAYAAYRFDDGPDALRRRLRPYDTDILDTALGQGGAGGVAAEERSVRHEVATASVQRLTPMGLAPDGRLVMVALVTVSVTSDAGAGVQQRYLELFLASTPAGWRVAEVSA